MPTLAHLILGARTGAALNPGDRLAVVVVRGDRFRQIRVGRMTGRNPQDKRHMSTIEQALQCLERGDLAEAERLAQTALLDVHRRPDGLHVLALAALRRGRRHEALKALEEAVSLDPHNGDRLLSLSQLALELGEHARARVYAERLLAFEQHAAQASNCLGRALLGLRRAADAVAAHETSVARAPRDPKYWSDLGTARLAAGHLQEAITAFRTVARLAPQVAVAHFNLATALLNAEQVDEAACVFEQTTRLDAGHAKAHENLGIALKRLGRVDEALRAQQTALRLAPGDPDVMWNLALTELLLGDFETGFDHFEARLRLPSHKLFGRATWQGAPIPDRDLMIVGEQGLGDTLQFLRFAEAAAARARCTTLHCRSELLALLRAGYHGPVRLEPLEADAHAPPDTALVSLMSLPHVLGVGSQLAAPEPYLEVAPEEVAAWRARLPDDRFCVGLSWQGNPSYRADRERSVSLRRLEPLLDVPGCHFVSLQRGHGSEQLADLPTDCVEDLGNTLDPPGKAFVGTAPLIGALDLVITTDTAVAHLAGAMGAPVWMLLSKVPDFRWGLSGNRWYPSMRLFRQRTAGAWDPVVASVRTALEAQCEKRAA